MSAQNRPLQNSYIVDNTTGQMVTQHETARTHQPTTTMKEGKTSPMHGIPLAISLEI